MENCMPPLIVDLIYILLGGLIGGMIAKALKQPLIIGYILAGVIVGPNTGGIMIESREQVSTLAEVGVALLLFSLGIEFSLRDLKPIGKIAGIGAMVQVTLTLVFGYFLGRWIGWNNVASFCLAICLVSSSTAVILKSLVTTGHTGSLSGRVMLGMSIVQDLTVIPLMIVLASVHTSEGGLVWGIAKPIGLAIVFVGLMVLVGSRIIPKILQFVAQWQSQELFLFSVIAISLGIGWVSYMFGLSLAFGAFVAGLVLAGSDYGNKALSEMIPLRDVFALVFFVSVGMLLQPSFIWANIGTISLLVFVGCVSRGLILAFMCRFFGYRNIIPLAAFLSMMPISEIGFIVISMAGANFNGKGPIVDLTQYSMILNMIVLSMLIGPFIAVFTGPIYSFYGKCYAMFWHRTQVQTVVLEENGLSNHVIIAGGRYLAQYIARVLHFLRLPYVVIEPNHQLFVKLQRENLRTIFGDPTHQAILAAGEISKARLLIITQDAYVDIVGIVRTAKELRPDLQMIVQFEGQDNLQQLRDWGIDEIVQPEYEVGLEMLRQALNSQHVSTQETEHYLDEIRQMLYSPLTSPYGDRRLLGRLRKTMGLLELEWILFTGSRNLDGKTIGDVAAEITVVGIMRDGSFRTDPQLSEPLLHGDCLAVVGTTMQIENVERIFATTPDLTDSSVELPPERLTRR